MAMEERSHIVQVVGLYIIEKGCATNSSEDKERIVLQRVCVRSKEVIRHNLLLLRILEEIITFHLFSPTKLFGLEDEEFMEAILGNGMMEHHGLIKTGDPKNPTTSEVERIASSSAGAVTDEVGTIFLAVILLRQSVKFHHIKLCFVINH